MRAEAHVFVLDVLESLQEPLLIVLGQGLIGHREQAVVLLFDVFPQQADVALGIVDELSDRFALASGGPLDCIGHATNMGPALLMLGEHHARGTALAGKPLGLHRRKKVCFFLAVVAAVGEVAEEVQRLLRRGLVQSPLGRTVLGDFLQAIEHLLDDPVFAAKDFSRFHRRLLEKRVVACSIEILPRGRQRH